MLFDEFVWPLTQLAIWTTVWTIRILVMVTVPLIRILGPPILRALLTPAGLILSVLGLWLLTHHR